MKVHVWILTLLLACTLATSSTSAHAADPGDIEPALLPLVGGDTDFGVGIGALGSLSKLGYPVSKYRWKLQFTAITTFKFDDGITSPYQDYVLRFTYIDFPVKRGRLDLLGSYTHAQLNYPGLGNASGADGALNQPYNHYDRAGLMFQAIMRSPITKRLYHESSFGFTHNTASYASDSRIAVDQRSADPIVRKGAYLPESSGAPMFVQAIGWDSRDREVATANGMWHRASFRVVPGGAGYFSTPYAGANLYLRGYHTLVRDRWILAWRVIGDLLLGDAPTYELGRHEMGWALGGTDGLRGVPAQRYYGAVKGMATLEMRFWIFDFRVLGQKMRFGAAGFGEAGRVFAATTSRMDLDGVFNLQSIKYGVGGGPRLAQGKQFEARLDVAYSPDAKPVGIYVGAGQAF